MKRKSSASLAQEKLVKKSVTYIPDEEIDFSDIPELTDEQLKEMKKNQGRPPIGLFPRKSIAIRIDEDVLDALRKEAKKKGTGYQTLINDILAKHIKRKAA